MSTRVERGRTLARSQALQLLFQAEALDKDLDQVINGEYLLSKGPLEPYAVVLARGCYDNIERIDEALMSVSTNWRLDRMPGTDRNILRIAVYEMLMLPEAAKLDVPIVISEAVNLAKAYGTDESARFINGVLGRIARDPALVPSYAPEVAAPEAGQDDSEPVPTESALSASSVPSGESANDGEDAAHA